MGNQKKLETTINNNSSYPNFGVHSITFLGFLYASILSGTIPLLEYTKDIVSALMLFLLWIYLAEDWLLKYSIWRGIEKIKERVDRSDDGIISTSELKKYFRICIANFILMLFFLVLMVVSFYVYLHKQNSYMNSLVEVTLGLSLLMGWIWNIFITKEISLGKTKLRTIYWMTLTLRAHKLEDVKDYYMNILADGPKIDTGYKAFRIFWAFLCRSIFIHAFVGLTLIIKPLIGFFLVLQIDSIFVNPIWDIDPFLFGCIYLVFQLVVDIFTLNLFNVPYKRVDAVPNAAKAESK